MRPIAKRRVYHTKTPKAVVDAIEVCIEAGWKCVWTITPDRHSDTHVYCSLLISPAPTRRTIYVEHKLDRLPVVELVDAIADYYVMDGFPIPKQPTQQQALL